MYLTEKKKFSNKRKFHTGIKKIYELLAIYQINIIPEVMSINNFNLCNCFPFHCATFNKNLKMKELSVEKKQFGNL